MIGDIGGMRSAEDALCRQSDAEAWYPEKGDNQTARVKRICRQCPIQPECLQYALDHDERFGIWGGVSARERDYMTGRRRRPGVRR